MDKIESYPSKDIITTLMKMTGTKQTQLAEILGFKNQSNVSEILKRDMKFSVFIKMLDALGFEIVIQKKAVPIQISVDMPVKMRV